MLYGSPAYLGVFAGAGATGDALALAYLQARKWDADGDGGGTPQEGHWYHNSTDGNPRYYVGAAWAVPFATAAEGVLAGTSLQPMAYIPVAQPTGMTTAAEAVYQFDATASSLLDRTANAHDLTVTAGAARYTADRGGIIGFLFDGQTTVLRNAADAALLITGDLTLACQVWVPSTTTQKAVIGHGISGGAEAQNWAYGVNFGDGTRAGTVYWYQEYGVSTANAALISGGVLGGPALVHIVRSGTTSLTMYVNGVAVGTGTLTNNPPTGGGDGRLTFGAGICTIYSAKITAAAFSAAQVLEEAQNCNMA